MDAVQPPGPFAPRMQLRKRLYESVFVGLINITLDANSRQQRGILSNRRSATLRGVPVVRGELVESRLPAGAVAVVGDGLLHLWMQRFPNGWPVSAGQV